MSTSVEWFKEEWLSSDSKALGIYMALLSMLYPIYYFYLYGKILAYYTKYYAKERVSEKVEEIAKGEERFEVWEVVDKFIETFYSLYSIPPETREEARKVFEEARKVLEELEKKYYEKFKKACYKYLNKNIIEKYKKYGKYIVKVLRKIKAGECPRSYVYKTSCGSMFIFSLSNFIKDQVIKDEVSVLLTGGDYDSLREDEREYADAISNFLLESGILWFVEGVNRIIPAPFLEEEFLEKLEKKEEITVEEITEEIAKEEEKVVTSIKIGEEVKIGEMYKDKKPSREILESIVANVLERFGFRVETNKMAKTKEGREIEVDVWGIKTIGNTRFYVYASCKNWNKKVDRNVIFSEIGRISKLVQQPHLKIFVCKELTDPARESALTDGFTVIELKEKANSKNADEIAEIIYNHLNEIFTGIASPELQRIAKETKAYEIKLTETEILIFILIFVLILIYLYFSLFNYLI